MESSATNITAKDLAKRQMDAVPTSTLMAPESKDVAKPEIRTSLEGDETASGCDCEQVQGSCPRLRWSRLVTIATAKGPEEFGLSRAASYRLLPRARAKVNRSNASMWREPIVQDLGQDRRVPRTRRGRPTRRMAASSELYTFSLSTRTRRCILPPQYLASRRTR